MDSNYSLADIATATNSLGGGNEFIWIFALLILFGGGGFWNNRANTDSAVANNEILLGQKFDALGRQVNQIGDGISSLGYSQLQQMDANTASINGNIVNEGRAIQTQLCAINSNIDNKFAQLEKSQLEQTINAQAQQISQLAMAQQMAGVVKYPMVSSYAMLNNPFCSCNTCCAN